MVAGHQNFWDFNLESKPNCSNSGERPKNSQDIFAHSLGSSHHIPSICGPLAAQASRGRFHSDHCTFAVRPRCSFGPRPQGPHRPHGAVAVGRRNGPGERWRRLSPATGSSGGGPLLRRQLLGIELLAVNTPWCATRYGSKHDK